MCDIPAPAHLSPTPPSPYPPPYRYQEELAIVDAELSVVERQISQQRNNAFGGAYGGGMFGGGGMTGAGGAVSSSEDLDRLKKQRAALQVRGGRAALRVRRERSRRYVGRRLGADVALTRPLQLHACTSLRHALWCLTSSTRPVVSVSLFRTCRRSFRPSARPSRSTATRSARGSTATRGPCSRGWVLSLIHISEPTRPY